MATLNSGNCVKRGSGMNGIAEKKLETWQGDLDPGKRWMEGRDCWQSLKLCTAMLHVLHFLNFEVCCEITDYIIMLSRHQCLQ